VVTSTIVFEGEGKIEEYIGGYDDWIAQKPQVEVAQEISAKATESPKKERARKLTFKEKRELEVLPLQIEELETETAKLQAKMTDPEFYRTSGEQVAATTTRLETAESELAEIYARWEELDALI
jgi:ATP-binding cassette subfamily F protein uup